MSNIEPNIIDPTKGPSPLPGPFPKEDRPDGDHVGDDTIREPDVDVPAIEPDPEEGGDLPSDIERAAPRV